MITSKETYKAMIKETKKILNKFRKTEAYNLGRIDEKAKTKEIIEKLTRKGYSQDDEWINRKQLLQEIEKC